MTTLQKSLTYQGIPVWRHVLVIQWTTQIVSGILVVTLVVWFFANLASAIQDRNIPFGFWFLDNEYLTPIGQFYVPYETSDSYLKAFMVAFANTLIVSVVGVILATLLGITVGVGRMSGNWIVSRAALGFIEFFRNVPLLVQLYFWFTVVLALPRAREGYVIADSVFLSNAGLWVPWPTIEGAGAALVWVVFAAAANTTQTSAAPALVWVVFAAAAVFVGVAVYRRQLRRETLTGAASYPVLLGFGAAVGIGAVAWVVIGAASGVAPFVIDVPSPEGAFSRIQGGQSASGGMIALLAGLVMYTAAFIAEIVRAGIQSVGRGQRESARALGLSWAVTLRSVTFPQALRVIVPPLISQYLNLTKNSSLASAIGFSDLFSVAETMTQKAPTLSIFLMVMLAYLSLSLTYSLIGNLYNRRLRN